MLQWASILVLLVSLATGVAWAEDLPGRGGAIHFTPPPGLCILPKTDPDYPFVLAQQDAAEEGRFSVQAMFFGCDDLKDRDKPPHTIGVVAFKLENGVVGAASDDMRSEYLKAFSRDLPTSPDAQSRLESVSNGVLFSRSVKPVDLGGEPYAMVSVDGVTVVRDTPVVISLQRLIPVSDTTSTLTALDGLREQQRANMEAFAKANGFSIKDAASAEDIQAARILGVLMGCAVIGAILIFAVAVELLWAQAILTVLVTIGGALVYQAAPGSTALSHSRALDIFLFLLGALAMLLAGDGLMRLAGALRLGRTTMAALLRGTLSPRYWTDPPSPPPSVADFTKRWFVAVAAATGSVIGTLITDGKFIHILLEAFSPARIIFTLLVTVVSITLIGPVEEYIFGSRFAAARPAAEAGEEHETHEAEPSRFEHMMQLMSPRAFGRFMLVLFFMLQLTVLHGTLEERVHEGDATASLQILLAALPAGVITYYWCAALQAGAASVMRRSGAAATLAGALLTGLPLFMGVTIFTGVKFAAAGAKVTALAPALLLLLALAIPGALVFGLLMMGISAYAGGWMIDRSRRLSLAPAACVALIGVGLCLATLVLIAVAAVLMTMVHVPLDAENQRNLGFTLVIQVGWTVGLLVAGFPDVLRAGRDLLTPPAAAAEAASA